MRRRTLQGVMSALLLALGLGIMMAGARADDVTTVMKAEADAAKVHLDKANGDVAAAAKAVTVKKAAYDAAVGNEAKAKAEYDKTKAKADTAGPNQDKAKAALPLFEAEWDTAKMATTTAHADWQAAIREYQRLQAVAVTAQRDYNKKMVPVLQQAEINRLKNENGQQQTQIADLTKRVGKLEGDLKTETAQRTDDVKMLKDEDKRLDQAVKDEAKVRKTADDDLQSQIDKLRGDIKLCLESVGELKIADMKLAEKLATTAGDVDKLSSSLTATRGDLAAYKVLLDKAVADAKAAQVQPITYVAGTPMPYTGIVVGEQYCPAHYQVESYVAQRTGFSERRYRPVLRAALPWLALRADINRGAPTRVGR